MPCGRAGRLPPLPPADTRHRAALRRGALPARPGAPVPAPRPHRSPFHRRPAPIRAEAPPPGAPEGRTETQKNRDTGVAVGNCRRRPQSRWRAALEGGGRGGAPGGASVGLVHLFTGLAVAGGLHPAAHHLAHHHRQDEADDRNAPQDPVERAREQHAPVAVRDRHRAAQVVLHLVAEQRAEDHRHQRHVELAQRPAHHPEADHQIEVEGRARDAVDADEADHRNGRHQDPRRDQQQTREQADHRDVEREQHHVRDEERRDQAPDDIRVLGEEQRTRGDVEAQQHRQQHRRGARARHAKRQHRHQRATGGSVVARLGGGDAARVALAEGALAVDELLLHRIAEEGPERGPCPRQHPRDEAQNRAAQHRRRGLHQRLRRGRETADHHRLVRRVAVAVAVLEEDEDLGQRKEADDRDEEVDAVIEMHLAEGEARHAGLGVDADHGKAKAKRGGKGGFRLVRGADAAERGEGQREEGEILVRPEQERDLHQLRGEQDQPPGGEERADEGGDARQRQRLAGAAGLGHRIAVETGHHRRLVARDVEQDRADAPAIHRPVIDRGQQDQRRRGAKAEGEGERNEDRDAVRGPKPRQRAHDRAKRRAEKGERQILPGDRDRETVGKVGKRVHDLSSEAKRAARERQPEREVEDGIDAKRDADAHDRALERARAEPPGEIGRGERRRDDEAQNRQQRGIEDQHDACGGKLGQPLQTRPDRVGIGFQRDRGRGKAQHRGDDEGEGLGPDRIREEAFLDRKGRKREADGEQDAEDTEDTVAHGSLPRLADPSGETGGTMCRPPPATDRIRVTGSLDDADLAREVGDLGHRVGDELVEVGALEVERREAVRLHHLLPLVRRIKRGDLVDPGVIGLVRHALRRIEAAPVRAERVDALLLGGREAGEFARQTLGREHGEHLDVTRIDKALGLGEIAGEGLHRARQQLRHRLAAAVEGDILDAPHILDAIGAGRDQHLQVVPAAHCRAARESDRGRIGLHLVQQFRQRVDRAVLGHGDHAVIGTDRGDPADLIHGVARIGVLREPRRGRGRGRDDQVVVVATLVDDFGEGHATAAASQVRHLHRLVDQPLVLHHLADLTAGEVPAAAGVRGGDALGVRRHPAVGDGGQRARTEKQGGKRKPGCLDHGSSSSRVEFLEPAHRSLRPPRARL
ncbi:hypothetical protein SDC9_26457 [bioreactor metagenome]|uniref:Uncharacterized protein n=1 Tax=bioreactor metagenome TaxID=1076179 RepID=A0A644UNB3_9ZZZZ